jgi:hypothetical protein
MLTTKRKKKRVRAMQEWVKKRKTMKASLGVVPLARNLDAHGIDYDSRSREFHLAAHRHIHRKRIRSYLSDYGCDVHTPRRFSLH